MEYRFKIADLILILIGAFGMGTGFGQVADRGSENDFPILFLIGFFMTIIPILKSRVRIVKKMRKE